MSCPNENSLEGYVFRRLKDGEHVRVEEHLLVCHKCQDFVSQTDELILLLKAAEARGML
ncbi:MAG TPA: hypothetical protein VEQ63_09795 [Bryobacteraceae bacterium]|nr:hypothetical protein [Bryobacteraceae bacterium]